MMIDNDKNKDEVDVFKYSWWSCIDKKKTTVFDFSEKARSGGEWR